jgi:hypothetical protein
VENVYEGVNVILLHKETNATLVEPCPCCGSLDIVFIVYPKQENVNYTYFSERFAIRCNYTGDDKGCGLESGHYKSLDEAAESWNQRINL